MHSINCPVDTAALDKGLECNLVPAPPMHIEFRVVNINCA